MARTPEELRALLQERYRREARSTMTKFATHALKNRGEVPAAHHRLICDELMKVCSGEVDRLMILAPPGSAKSTYATKIFPAFFLSKHPTACVISASHTGGLALDFGRAVRGMVTENSDVLGYTLSDDSRAADAWISDRGGIYRAAGVGQAIAGRRADLAVIDDPVSGRDSAESESDRNRVWDWYVGDLYNRLRPGARVVLIMTRWHEDDLGGRLLDRAASGSGDKWRILRLPALAYQPTDKHYEPDPLGRAPGEALWPEWENAEALQRKRNVIGERDWISQYQQQPRPDDGSIFHPTKLVWVGSVDESQVEQRIRAWDLASTEQVGGNDPDWLVGARMAILKDGRPVIEHIERHRVGPHQMVEKIVEVAKNDGTDIPISLPQDPGSAGKIQVAFLVSRLAGYIVDSSPETGSKTTRASPLASQVNAGNVTAVSGLWKTDLVDELAAFPNGRHDDQVDALSRAFSRLVAKMGGLGVLQHYQSMAASQGSTPTTTDTSARTGPNRPVLAAADGAVVDAFRKLQAELGGGRTCNCKRCGQPIMGDTRIDDGVDMWHMECA